MCIRDRNDSFIFGPETRGLPHEILNSDKVDKKIRIPMVKIIEV